MQDSYLYLTIAVAALAAVALLSSTALRAWRDWLQLKQLELARGGMQDESAPPSSMARIELADLKERIRKLEAIAAGVEL